MPLRIAVAEAIRLRRIASEHVQWNTLQIYCESPRSAPELA